ncbi:cation-transporting P-type ATPase [Paucilactobacillus hokkaidonensis JCM 18461]|uniref:P-type Ca(2+) transporter n=2 Tax=Paucilactobacillus hokkaidonensis TaxID=1193095 RepID=A0A0A1GRQ0_9LACO|nr:calcium-translocating P-type ATPase, PMCA-type [Paucilactobacillus hokkaidonensis]KRO11452.1 cation transporting P-type ATPase [Paucilactobacillus hokkaidonensis]BAP84997.1 cation-transporting P-type ATPase [Paucilactobacillus hokkaidonensis JCM 18461]
MKRLFYNQPIEQVFDDVHTKTSGLTNEEVEAKRSEFGANELEQKKQTSLLEKFFNQFKDLMIIVLIVAALIAAVSGELVDAIIIMLVVILNAMFGVFQEAKAENAINALKEMSAPDAHVRRGDQVVTVKSDELVPGDIVLLEAGDIVPADMRLIEGAALKIEEAALTGESVATEKQFNVLEDETLGIGDRSNMAYMNTNVTYGRATGVVVATGMQTEMGRIAGMLNKTAETQTPLQANLQQLGKVLTFLILIIAVIVFVIGLIRGEETVLDMLLTAISLAVAAIPEGLPAIVTITLALGTQRMVKRHALIRKLPAVETLGSTDIIASDKTGTLTQNKMTVERLYTNGELTDSSEQQDESTGLLTKIMVLANDTKQTSDGLQGDPTETALVQYALDHNVNVEQLMADNQRVAEIPFDSERKLMTTIHQNADGIFAASKGAPDALLTRITKIEIDGNVQPMDEQARTKILQQNHDLATQALRVLAFAYKPLQTVPSDPTSEDVENDLIFVGLIGMIDPERPEAAESVAKAHQAGIKTIMITGDHRDTAQAIANRLGIVDDGEDDAVITGAQLDEQDDATFAKNVKKYRVYARVAPEHKVRIVKAWQKHGKVVAMTGDGVNDAPALKTADIGVGMGITGTEVSKGASEMVLADDNFATIVVAVEEGRKVFANIQKSIQYLLSANLGEVITLFMMTILGWQILAPVQILWINLVTDTFPAIALGVEPTEKNIMKRPPRGRSSNFLSGGVMSSVIYQGILEGLLTLGVYAYALLVPLHTGDAQIHADALTMAFATLGLIQLFHAFNSKSIHQSLFTIGFWKNKYFNLAILVAFLLLAITIWLPGFNQLFHVTHLELSQWAVVVIAGILMIVIVELVKLVQRKFWYNKK